MDQWAERRFREPRIERGLVGILCTLESCNSFQLIPGEGRPRLISRPRQQRVLYFLDPQLDLIHVRRQTWLPLSLCQPALAPVPAALPGSLGLARTPRRLKTPNFSASCMEPQP